MTWILKGLTTRQEWEREVTALAAMPPVNNHETSRRAAILLETVRGLTDLGWVCQRITAAPLTGQDTLTFTSLFRSSTGTRTLVFTVRREHTRFHEPLLAPFIGELYVEPSDGTPPLRIPVDAEYAVHVTRDDPVATVRALAIATDDELVTEYNPLAMERAASEAMKHDTDEIADVLYGCDGPSNLQRLDTKE